MEFQLISNVLETAYSSIIRSWCDEWHSHLLYYTPTHMFSQLKEQQSRQTERTAVSFITSLPDDRDTNSLQTPDTDAIFAHLTAHSCQGHPCHSLHHFLMTETQTVSKHQILTPLLHASLHTAARKASHPMHMSSPYFTCHINPNISIHSPSWKPYGPSAVGVSTLMEHCSRIMTPRGSDHCSRDLK